MKRLQSDVIRYVLLISLLIANVIVWIIPSNVLRLVARERHVMLGRYSRAHFSWALGLGVLTLLIWFILGTASKAGQKRRAFFTLTVIFGLIPALIATDVLLRALTVYPYVSDTAVYHRPPNWRFEGEYEDAPRIQRSYPVLQPGYGRLRCTMAYDANGFRNEQTLSSCDIVTVGDSFTEGQRVDGPEIWPALLQQQTGYRVYNLGISGYAPAEYLAALETYGLPLKPRLVICMMFEGNDFRSAAMAPRKGVSLGALVKTSPLLMGFDSFVVDTFGRIGARGAFKGSEVLDWLPLKVPNDERGRYYGFPPKQLTELIMDEENLEESPAWQSTQVILRQMRDRCHAIGARFVIAYAPNKAHAVLPLAASYLPIEKLRAFVALRFKWPLPAAPEFMNMLLSRLDTRQDFMRDWCESESIGFIALTNALRERAAIGNQVYYTYDQHWTPKGHAAVAGPISDAVQRLMATVNAERTLSANGDQLLKPER